MNIRSFLVAPLVVHTAASALANEPVLTVTEPGLGTWVVVGIAAEPVDLQVVTDTELNFSWLADASGYGGAILGYRYGWDVTDVDDPNDPGWSGPGFVADLLASVTRTFSSGTHSLHVEAMDTAGGLTRAWFRFEIEPEVPTASTRWGSIKATFAH